ncbi:hypothetical protein AWJ20_1924 [Sugiyamaella lignohabitans]|uniref:Uncharacterized protein n=1 Tax=Sugiyamaella lignohabitans TaxID=796027 RepID=A0A167E4C5_9ASCO|nr:uncharacterized protein AWJ20_1924 [Sugiyamaella lignohabitans]ANB13625.1 hypothetical protein AWJ20_1924 [Sugiyamaella lignohabitans]
MKIISCISHAPFIGPCLRRLGLRPRPRCSSRSARVVSSTVQAISGEAGATGSGATPQPPEAAPPPYKGYQLFISHVRCLDSNRRVELGTGVDGLVAKSLLDTEDLVQLGQTLGTGGSTGLDLSGSDTNRQVGNEGVLGLTRSVGNHDTPLGGVRVLGSLDRLGQGTDLVDLEEKSVSSLGLNGLGNELGVGNSQVITNNLDLAGNTGVELLPSGPVTLGEGVFKRDDGVLLNELDVVVGKLLASEPLRLVRLGVLEVQVVLLGILVVELGRSSINGNADLTSVTSSLDSSDNEVKSLVSVLNIRSNTTLITNVTSRSTILLLGQALELLVDLRASSKGIGERGESSRSNHELLDGQSTTGVRTTVDDVLERNWQNVRSRGTSNLSDVLVKRNALLSGTSTTGS